MTGLLDLVLPCAPRELVTPDGAATLAAVAPALPPFRVAGFECRLAADDDRVDFQLGYIATSDEPQLLARHLARRVTDGPGWERLALLAQRWADPGDPAAAAIAEIWLEFDRPATVGDELVPSVFATLRSGWPDAAVVLHTLLDGPGRDELTPILRRCADACPGRSWVSHVGMMLGRPVPAVRLHVSDLPLELMAEYLRAVGWPGDIDRIPGLAGELLAHGDRVIVCLDIVGGLLPTIGLECYFVPNEGVDPRWEPLMARLVSLGLAAPDKAAALTRWPGTHTPATARETWPDELIIADLGEAADRFAVVERRLSHVKISIAPDGGTAAKAYFGFGHVRYATRGQEERRVRAERRSRPPTRAEALDTGLTWLLSARNQAGLWRDFFDRARPAGIDRRITGYASDEWVTAYVAAMLTSVDDPRARVAAQHALGVLLTRRTTDAGWGYHALLPADADTTTWVLRTAAALGEQDCDRYGAARQFVASLTGPDGAVATYPRSVAPQLATFLRMPGGYLGWSAAHTCVTAAAAALGLNTRSVSFLVAAQRTDGSWSGHWWEDDEYTTARAVEVLASSGEHDDAVAAAARWAAGRIGWDGAVRPTPGGDVSAFATALALQIAAHGRTSDDQAAVARATRSLLEQQCQDGSWPPSARLRVPGPDAVDPRATPEQTRVYVDDDALFTTVTALSALAASAAPSASDR